jgi:hypothetical protein
MNAHFIGVDDGSLPGNPDEQKALLEEWTYYNLDRYYSFIEAFTFHIHSSGLNDFARSVIKEHPR